MTRSVWRKRLKVIGLLLSIMMLGLWGHSTVFLSIYSPPSGQWAIVTAFGRIFCGSDAMMLAGDTETGWNCFPLHSNWTAHMSQRTWVEFARAIGLSFPGMLGRTITVPVWLLVLAVGFPTAILWWRDRRPKAGFCEVCEYDLTGNESGTCPECGTAVE